MSDEHPMVPPRLPRAPRVLAELMPKDVPPVPRVSEYAPDPVNLDQMERTMGEHPLNRIAGMIDSLKYTEMMEFAKGLHDLSKNGDTLTPEIQAAHLSIWAIKRLTGDKEHG